jgi:hypothetical protein
VTATAAWLPLCKRSSLRALLWKSPVECVGYPDAPAEKRDAGGEAATGNHPDFPARVRAPVVSRPSSDSPAHAAGHAVARLAERDLGHEEVSLLDGPCKACLR